MREVRIGPFGQSLIVLGVMLAATATVVAELPELRRYLKVRSM